MIGRPKTALLIAKLLVFALMLGCAPVVSPIRPPEPYKGPIAEQPSLTAGDYWVYERANATRVKTAALAAKIGFPLWIGKTWSYESEALLRGQSPETSKRLRAPTRIDCQTAGFKQITVTAGTFAAFECECQCTVLSGSYDSSCGQWTIWYAPEVKNIIKLKTESTATTMEFVEYKSSRPAPSATVPPQKTSAPLTTNFEPTPESTQRALLRGEIKEALASYESQAMDAEKKAEANVATRQNWRAASNAYAEASRSTSFLGQLQKSIVYGEKALEAGMKSKIPREQLNAILRLINAHASVRNFDKAKEWSDKGFEIIKEIPPNTNTRISWEGVLYSELGRNLERRGEYVKAIDPYPLAIRLYEDWLANLYVQEKRNEREIERARTSIVNNLNLLGYAYLRTGKLEQAMEQYEKAFQSIRNWGLAYAFEDDLYRNVGEIYFRQKNFANALESFKRALALAEQQKRPAAIRNASGRVGDVLSELRKPREAIPYFQKTIQHIEATRSLLESVENRQSYFEGAGGAYTQMIRALLDAGQQVEAFNFAERARSRVFLDILGSKVQLARNGTLMEHERALQARISILQAMMSSQDAEFSQTPELRKELAEAQQAYNEYLMKVRKENKEQASLMNVEPLTLRQVQDLLDPGVTMLEYFVVNNRIWVWVIERDRLQFVWTSITRSELVSKVTDLRDIIYQIGEKERFNTISQELHKLLVQSALPHISGKELIIVPHDVLHYLPFQALLSPDGRYLIEQYPFSYLSSASLLQFTKEKRRAGGEKLLAFGNPDLNDSKMSLQFAEIEAREIKSLYPQSVIYLEKEATEEKAKLLSPQNDIIHFASHAELNENDPLASAILLAKSDKEDGKLEVREIFGMDLKAGLVVLSACETGLGKLSSGDELVGLTRAFIYAGTPSVVASLWSVDDSSTAALMASFYRNLKTMSKVEALRQAQLQLIRGEVRSDLLARRGIGGVGRLGEVPAPNSQSPIPFLFPPLIPTSGRRLFWWARGNSGMISMGQLSNRSVDLNLLSVTQEYVNLVLAYTNSKTCNARDFVGLAFPCTSSRTLSVVSRLKVSSPQCTQTVAGIRSTRTYLPSIWKISSTSSSRHSWEWHTGQLNMVTSVSYNRPIHLRQARRW